MQLLQKLSLCLQRWCELTCLLQLLLLLLCKLSLRMQVLWRELTTWLQLLLCGVSLRLHLLLGLTE